MISYVWKIAVTGGIASGKSMVGDYLRAQGVPVIDADGVVHQILRENTALQAWIREVFGQGVFASDGSLDRQALGAVVFQDAEKRRMLEQQIHPLVRQEMMAFYQTHADQAVGVALIPLLFESSLEKHYDEVWLLDVDEATQLERLMQCRGMSRKDALARIGSQLPLAVKKQRLNEHPHGILLDNTGTPTETYHRVDRLLAAAQRRSNTIHD